MAQKDNGEILIGSTTEDKGFDVSNTFPEIAGLVQGAVRCVPELQQVNPQAHLGRPAPARRTNRRFSVRWLKWRAT